MKLSARQRRRGRFAESLHGEVSGTGRILSPMRTFLVYLSRRTKPLERTV